MSWVLRVAIAGCLWGLGTSDARAEENAASRALSALVPYDLDEGRTLQALQVLRAEARLVASGKRKQELSFMRALGLTDLWLVASATKRETLLDQVASALGVTRDAAPGTLDAELAAVERDVVRDIVGDARRALRMAAPSPLGQDVRTDAMGPRAQAAYLAKVSAALVGGRDTVARLATLAEEPCPNPSACDGAYANFDQEGRRAVHALVLASDARRSFEREANDPFVMAMLPTLEEQLRALHQAELAPNLRLPQAQARAHATQGGSVLPPDVLVLVAADRVEYAFVPRVRVEGGKIALRAAGQPVFPSFREVKIVDTFPPFVRHIDEVTEALRGVRALAATARLAVGAAPGLPSHVWARTLLSAQAAGFDRLAMLGVNQAGELRGIDVELVGPLKAAGVGPRELSVTVRLGGFSVKRAGPAVTIPRVRNQSGFAFDYAGLLASARPEDVKSAKLTFMSEVATETLAEAAFLLAPRDQALTVVVP